MSEKTVTINGTTYDAHTGLPLTNEARVQALMSRPHHSQTVHSTTQKSQTLNRRIVKKATVRAPSLERPIQRSAAVTRFAPHPVAPAVKQVRSISDIGPVPHPMLAGKQSVQPAQHPQQKLSPKPSQVIKREAIAEALKKAPGHKENTKQHRTKKHPRLLSIASASLALLLLGSYFTYLNMPSLSVRVAAAQAGVNASYPEYRPDGYSLSGPVAYRDGEVTMKFASNGGPQNFTVAQAKSSWDSSAVLDNYVKDKAGDNYLTYNERGLTIYTFDGSAAWVNGGVLYTVTGDAPLSSDQIRRIASSM